MRYRQAGRRTGRPPPNKPSRQQPQSPPPIKPPPPPPGQGSHLSPASTYFSNAYTHTRGLSPAPVVLAAAVNLPLRSPAPNIVIHTEPCGCVTMLCRHLWALRGLSSGDCHRTRTYAHAAPARTANALTRAGDRGGDANMRIEPQAHTHARLAHTRKTVASCSSSKSSPCVTTQ
jgi:hypothetical protein